jgi:hypothetical protein
MRIESNRPAKGTGGGWIHRLAEPLPEIEVRRRPAPIVNIDWTRKAEQMFHHPDAHAARRQIAGQLGVFVESLELLQVGVGFDHDGRAFTSWPERTFQGKATGIVRRYSSGEKKMIFGGSHGLYVTPSWWTTQGPVYLPEGGNDTAALLSMGHCAVGRPSNLGGVNLLLGWFSEPDYRRQLIVLAERDEKPDRRGRLKQCPANCKGCPNCWPGLYGAKKTAEALRAAGLPDVCWRFAGEAKDVREWLQKHGVDGFEAALTTDATPQQGGAQHVA